MTEIDPLYSLGIGLAYYAIRFSDVPPDYILGGKCLVCDRTGPIDRVRVQERWGAGRFMRRVDPLLRCLGCSNTTGNTFTVVGRVLPPS